MNFKKIKDRKWRGSYTVEAAVIVPIVLILMGMVFTTSINLYENIRTTAEDTSALTELDCQKKFYQEAQLKQVANDILGMEDE